MHLSSTKMVATYPFSDDGNNQNIHADTFLVCPGD